jgi:hypothetical protein
MAFVFEPPVWAHLVSRRQVSAEPLGLITLAYSRTPALEKQNARRLAKQTQNKILEVS